jgi:hypothetical protein
MCWGSTLIFRFVLKRVVTVTRHISSPQHLASYNPYLANFSFRIGIMVDGILKSGWFEFAVHLSINCATEYMFAR